ncbi:MAG: DUF6056 family protein [Lachnospiraceae bacterium]|nr:DUF6056 family protein [Lachnospiraceae bacterium]
MKKSEKLISWLLILASLAVAVPVVIGSAYTYLSADDFSFEGAMVGLTELYGSPLKAALIRTWEYCLWREGCYLGNFLVHYVRPYTNGGLMGHPVVLVINSLFFLWSLHFMITTFFKKRSLTSCVLIFAVLVSTFQLSGTLNDQELFFWFTGAMDYSLEMSLLFLALAFYRRGADEERIGRKRLLYILSAVFGFLACGGSLEIVSPACSCMLLMLMLRFRQDRGRKISYVPFLGTFAGGLCNAVMPGNFVRSEETFVEGHITIWDAFRDAVVCYGSETKTILGSPVFLLLLAGTFAVCYVYRTELKRDGMSTGWILALIPGVFLMQYFMMFPVIYGSHTVVLNSGRTMVAYEIVARYLYLFYVICLAQWVREHVDAVKKIRVGIAVAFAAVVLFAVIAHGRVVTDIKEGFSYRIAADLRSGAMQETWALRAYTLSSLENAEEGTDGIVWAPYRAKARSMYSMGLSADCSEFNNVSGASLFRLKSATVVYPDE